MPRHACSLAVCSVLYAILITQGSFAHAQATTEEGTESNDAAVYRPWCPVSEPDSTDYSQEQCTLPRILIVEPALYKRLSDNNDSYSLTRDDVGSNETISILDKAEAVVLAGEKATKFSSEFLTQYGSYIESSGIKFNLEVVSVSGDDIALFVYQSSQWEVRLGYRNKVLETIIQLRKLAKNFENADRKLAIVSAIFAGADAIVESKGPLHERPGNMVLLFAGNLGIGEVAVVTFITDIATFVFSSIAEYEIPVLSDVAVLAASITGFASHWGHKTMDTWEETQCKESMNDLVICAVDYENRVVQMGHLALKIFVALTNPVPVITSIEYTSPNKIKVEVENTGFGEMNVAGDLYLGSAVVAKDGSSCNLAWAKMHFEPGGSEEATLEVPLAVLAALRGDDDSVTLSLATRFWYDCNDNCSAGEDGCMEDGCCSNPGLYWPAHHELLVMDDSSVSKESKETLINIWRQSLERTPRAVRQAFEKGHSLTLRKKWALALPHLNRAISLYPRHDFALNDRGLCYEALKRNAEAEADFKEAIRIHSSPEYHSNLGLLYCHSGKYGSAIQRLRYAVRLEPANIDSKQNLSRCLNKLGTDYMRKGDLDKAAKCFEEALELDPKDKNIRSNLELSRSKEQAATMLNENAIRLFKEGDLSLAIRILHEARRLSPRDRQIRQNLATALIERGVKFNKAGRYERAIKDLESARRLVPRDARATNSLAAAIANAGIKLCKNGDYSEGVKMLRKARKINPEDSIIKHNLEDCERKQKSSR